MEAPIQPTTGTIFPCPRLQTLHLSEQNSFSSLLHKNIPRLFPSIFLPTSKLSQHHEKRSKSFVILSTTGKIIFQPRFGQLQFPITYIKNYRKYSQSKMFYRSLLFSSIYVKKMNYKQIFKKILEVISQIFWKYSIVEISRIFGQYRVIFQIFPNCRVTFQVFRKYRAIFQIFTFHSGSLAIL